MPDRQRVTPGTASREITVANARGLHARAAARFVSSIRDLDAQVLVRKDDNEVSGHSIMGLMTLAAKLGSVLHISATGPDAEAAVSALAALVENRFGEE
jgi:phosphocarrier protein